MNLGRKLRHLQRYRDIAKAFARNGFGFLIKELGLPDLTGSRIGLKERQDARSRTLGERIRIFLEELGPTFIKIGQIASTRPDLLPAHIIEELVKLQDQVPPFPFEQVREVIENEFGEPFDTLFADFQETPMAAASIGQVHLARLHTGEVVAVKIQRPNIPAIVATDLEILDDLARLAEHRLAWAAKYQLRDMVYELSQSLRAELDYTNEGRNAQRMAKSFERDPHVRFPSIYWDYTSRNVLTMDFIEGVKTTEVQRLDELGYDRKRIAEQIARVVFRQIFIDGFFHADPHPGNIIVLPEGVIGLIDFGMVGRLTPMMKYHFGSLVIALRRNSTDGVLKAIDGIGIIPEDVDMDSLRGDIDELREKYYDVPLSRISLGESVSDLLSVAYEHRIRVPSDLTLLGKTLLTLEGVVTALDPTFSVVNIAEPFGRKLFAERFSPRNVADSVWNQMGEYAELLSEMPSRLREMFGMMKKGKLRMDVSVSELDTFMKKMDRISNRLSFSIVLLSFSIIMVGLIIGSSLGRQSTLLWNFPVIEIGFSVAALMFLWMFYSIFKSGRF
ncbi:AarF/ABC1/UbiB kinase family protein [Paenibacillus sp. H1-7]|uniref:ABC1 kinase family protein n=1 Tax=Paenibacillus sp. H1-7 TaxID=2282849 RepID=UPI001EF92FE4|nr:AarF/ABC1/UbiB kinase family protein [Paenibacillus sp. H1-7]ULL15306.1 AarF/ABC1/UbiB kinase family protein [Paenibacillus sp. H1-7]